MYWIKVMADWDGQEWNCASCGQPFFPGSIYYLLIDKEGKAVKALCPESFKLQNFSGEL